MTNSLTDLNGAILRFVSENGFTVLEIQQKGDGDSVRFLNSSGDVVAKITGDGKVIAPRVVAEKFQLGDNVDNYFYLADGELRFSSADGHSYHVELSDPQT